MTIEEIIQRGRGLKVAAYVKAIRAHIRETVASPTPETELEAVEKMTAADWYIIRTKAKQAVASQTTTEQIVNVFRVAAEPRAACGCHRPDAEGHTHGCTKYPFIPAPTIGGAP